MSCEKCPWGNRGFCYTSAKGKTEARELLPEEDVRFWDRRVGGEEGDDGVGIGGGNSREEGGGVEGALSSALSRNSVV